MVSTIIENAQVAQQTEQNASEIVVLHHVVAETIVPLIKALYPTLQVASTTSNRSAGPVAAAPTGGAPGAPGAGPVVDRWSAQSYGAIGLVGPKELVQQAIQTIAKLDVSTRNGGDNVVSKVYELKYMNGPSVESFLRKAAPEIDVFV